MDTSRMSNESKNEEKMIADIYPTIPMLLEHTPVKRVLNRTFSGIMGICAAF